MKSISFQTPLPPALRTASPPAPEAAEGSESADPLSAAARPSPAQARGCPGLGVGDGGLPHPVRGGGRRRAGRRVGARPLRRCSANAGASRGSWTRSSPERAARLRRRLSAGAHARARLSTEARDPLRPWGSPRRPEPGRALPNPAGFRGAGRGRYLPSAAAGRDAGG